MSLWKSAESSNNPVNVINIFMCGDVMTGRGIDQIMPHPGDPALHEPSTAVATDYLALAEMANGPIPRGVPFGYVWGDAREELDQVAPDLRIVNLETAITTSPDYCK